ncbi:MAG: hypothetical protein ACJAUY_000096 [Cognaticolwellia sp.]|jgi:hypothetical protein
MDKNMITSDTLILKLKLQSKLLAKSLNLPTNFGYDLLATAIYQHKDFEYLCDSVSEFDNAVNFESLSEYQKLKYLLICEIEDQKLIKDLHIEIEKMALRLEERTVINISKIDLISNLFKLFGLENESRYIVDAEDIKLKWQPYFESLQDHQAVLRTDLLINEIPFRLIATKVSFDEYSVNNLMHSLNTNLAQKNDSSAKANEERINIDEHIKWLANSCDCLSNVESDTPDQHPEFYKINNQNHLVYGFPLSPHISVSENYTNINIHIKDTEEHQIFILNIESEKLTFECIFLQKAEKDVDKCYSPESQWINDTLLNHESACQFPLVFNHSYYLMFLRPFAHIDFLENAL